MMADFDEKVEATVCSETPAAIDIAHRQGLGKTRHMEVQYLWKKREGKEGKLTVTRVGEMVIKYKADVGFEDDSSRAITAPTL